METVNKNNDGMPQETGILVGGTKGHIVESIGGNLLKLFQFYPWKPIVRCSGRYTCRDHTVSHLPPEDILERAGIDTIYHKEEFQLPGRPDNILVLSMDETNTTGLITYVKSTKNDQESQNQEEKRYVHTLNTPSGFRRKLEAVGIDVAKDEFVVRSVPSSSSLAVDRSND